MTPEQFVYWLQGFVEIREKEQVGLTEREWDIIKDHLQTVFEKRTPDRTIYPTTSPDFGISGTGTWPPADHSKIIC